MAIRAGAAHRTDRRRLEEAGRKSSLRDAQSIGPRTRVEATADKVSEI
jgi:hypothetical protein